MQNFSELTRRNIREGTQNFWYIHVYSNQNSRTIGEIYTKHANHVKVGHSSNFLYQEFAKKYFLGIYSHSKA